MFIELAEDVKKRLEQRFPCPHGYSPQLVLQRMISDWKLGKATQTDVGQFAIHALDSGTPEDDRLCNDICKVANMYNRQGRIQTTKLKKKSA